MYEYTVPVDYIYLPLCLYKMISVPWLSKMLVVKPETALEERVVDYNYGLWGYFARVWLFADFGEHDGSL